jgi:hypothetical protein
MIEIGDNRRESFGLEIDARGDSDVFTWVGNHARHDAS